MTRDGGKIKKCFSCTALIFIALCCFAALIKKPDIAIGYMKSGLRLCAETVIPSLFPFMVLSGLFVELGLSEIFAFIFSKPMKLLFGTSGAGAAAPIMGALCGFPVGALTAHRLYAKGRISSREAARLIAFSNNPSSAFLISAVGTALWSCPKFGIVLYIIQLLSAAIIGIAMRFISPPYECDTVSEGEKMNGFSVRTLTKVISESAISMLNICALILFFASLVGALTSFLEGFGIIQSTKTLIYGFFEMTGAVREASKILPIESGMIITALICGWSGLSVHFQVISICFDDGIGFAPYFAAKLSQGILSALFMLFYISFIDKTLPSLCLPALASGVALSSKSTTLSILSNAVLIIGLIYSFLGKYSRCTSHTLLQGRGDNKRP